MSVVEQQKQVNTTTQSGSHVQDANQDPQILQMSKADLTNAVRVAVAEGNQNVVTRIDNVEKRINQLQDDMVFAKSQLHQRISHEMSSHSMSWKDKVGSRKIGPTREQGTVHPSSETATERMESDNDVVKSFGHGLQTIGDHKAGLVNSDVDIKRAQKMEHTLRQERRSNVILKFGRTLTPRKDATKAVQKVMRYMDTTISCAEKLEPLGPPNTRNAALRFKLRFATPNLAKDFRQACREYANNGHDKGFNTDFDLTPMQSKKRQDIYEQFQHYCAAKKLSTSSSGTRLIFQLINPWIIYNGTKMTVQAFRNATADLPSQHQVHFVAYTRPPIYQGSPKFSNVTLGSESAIDQMDTSRSPSPTLHEAISHIGKAPQQQQAPSNSTDLNLGNDTTVNGEIGTNFNAGKDTTMDGSGNKDANSGKRTRPIDLTISSQEQLDNTNTSNTKQDKLTEMKQQATNQESSRKPKRGVSNSQPISHSNVNPSSQPQVSATQPSN